MTENNKEIQGYPTEQIGAAVRKLRQSQGITSKVLAREAELYYKSVTNFEAGNKPLSEASILRIGAVLGLPTVKEMVQAAERVPEISKSKVAQAIHRFAVHRDLSVPQIAEMAGLNPRNLECFVAARTHENNPHMSLESTFFAAKALGFTSLAGLVSASEELHTVLESERYKTPEFRAAVRELQKDKGINDVVMASKLGIKTPAYKNMLLGHHAGAFTVPVLEKLPEILGVRSLDEIVPSAKAIEGVPQGLNKAFAILRDRVGWTNAEFARLSGCTIHEVNRAMHSHEGVAVFKLRKMANALGLKTFSQAIEEADSSTKLTVAAYGKNKQSISISGGDDTTQFGHWTSLVDASRVAENVLPRNNRPGRR